VHSDAGRVWLMPKLEKTNVIDKLRERDIFRGSALLYLYIFLIVYKKKGERFIIISVC
jgi:hypothetical protein